MSGWKGRKRDVCRGLVDSGELDNGTAVLLVAGPMSESRRMKGVGVYFGDVRPQGDQRWIRMLRRACLVDEDRGSGPWEKRVKKERKSGGVGGGG